MSLDRPQATADEMLYQKNSLEFFFNFCNNTGYFFKIMFPSTPQAHPKKLDDVEKIMNHFNVNLEFDNMADIKAEKDLDLDTLMKIILSPTGYIISEIDFYQKIKDSYRESKRCKFFNFLKDQTKTSKMLLHFFEGLINQNHLMSVTNFTKLFFLSEEANRFKDKREKKLVRRLCNRDELTITAPISILKSIIWFGINNEGKKIYFISPENDYFVGKDGNQIDINTFVGIAPTDPIEVSMSQDCQNLLSIMVSEYNTMPIFYNQHIALKDFCIDEPKIGIFYKIRDKRFTKSLTFNIAIESEEIEKIEVSCEFKGYEEKVEHVTKQNQIKHKNTNNQYKIKVKFKNENRETKNFFRDILNKIIINYRRQFGFDFKIVHDVLNFEINKVELVIVANQEIKQQNLNEGGDHLAIDFSKEINFIPQIKPFLNLLNLTLTALKEFENSSKN